jgi:DNA-directed RNA polymerase subunit F
VRTILRKALVMLLLLGSPSISANEALRDELLEMGRRDQEIRERVIAIMPTIDLSAPTDEWRAIVDEMSSIDRENMRRLVEIVMEFGWPGRSLVGREASLAAEVMLQHAELEQLRQLVPFLRGAVDAGEASPPQLAMAEDQIRVEEGRKQIYGTEVTQGPDGIPRLYPLEDPESVDERRKLVGLPPLDEYLRQAEQEIGKPIER